MTDEERLAVVASAREWIGTRWQHGRSLKGVACDCIGLVVGVMRERGLYASELPRYQREADGETLMAMLDAHLRRVQIVNARPGDIGVFRFDKYPTHLSLFGNRNSGLSMIHASVTDRRVVEHRMDDVWRNRLIAVFTL